MRLSVAFSAKANPQHFWFLFSTSSGCLFVCLRFSMLLSVMCVCVGWFCFIFLSLIHPSLLINWIGTEWPAILNGKLALPISQWIDKLITKGSYIYWITINTHTHTLLQNRCPHSFGEVKRIPNIRKNFSKLFHTYSKLYSTERTPKHIISHLNCTFQFQPNHSNGTVHKIIYDDLNYFGIYILSIRCVYHQNSFGGIGMN